MTFEEWVEENYPYIGNLREIERMSFAFAAGGEAFRANMNTHELEHELMKRPDSVYREREEAERIAKINNRCTAVDQYRVISRDVK